MNRRNRCPWCGDDSSVLFVELEPIMRDDNGIEYRTGFVKCFARDCDYESPLYSNREIAYRAKEQGGKP